jgi:hypothetical protein
MRWYTLFQQQISDFLERFDNHKVGFPISIVKSAHLSVVDVWHRGCRHAVKPRRIFCNNLNTPELVDKLNELLGKY